MTKEITASELKTEQFINEKVNMIRSTVGDGIAINALSGGVDSSVVTMLGHQALGGNLKTCFIENGLMRESEPEMVKNLFRKHGVTVEIIDAREEFLTALKG
ncbi:MAG: GMP synthase (glutamine-hydrolyzing), partial [Bacteroidales bacterium]|nr:GMP synthase (glutamine-hydrolyzing) [Bacteroidales bacterium]